MGLACFTLFFRSGRILPTQWAAHWDCRDEVILQNYFGARRGSGGVCEN